MTNLKETTFTSVALIAGKGNICFQLKQAMQKKGLESFVVAYEGITDAELTRDCAHKWFRLGQVGAVIQELQKRNIHHVTMIGTWPRPSFSSLWPDSQGLKLMAALGAFWKGDDHVLQKIVDFLAGHGLTVLAPQELMEGLFQRIGALGKTSPDTEALQDIQKASAVLTDLSPWDFSQGLAIQQGLILALEAAEGTDACIQRAGALKRLGARPIYVKMAKKGQSYRVDLPVIGLRTLQGLVEAGFQGLAFQATSTLVVAFQEVQAYADANHIFLWGF